MERLRGIHFYINIANLNDVVLDEEKTTGKVNHSVHAVDTFFTSIETFSKKNFSDILVVEKITGSRLHMYVLEEINTAFRAVAEIAKYANSLTKYLNNDIAKYKTLMNFKIQIGACFGTFYNFEFKRVNADEETTIGYAANYAAKLQGLTAVGCISVSSNIVDELQDVEYKKRFTKKNSSKIAKYKQTCYYEAAISNLISDIDYEKDLEASKTYANKVNLTDMEFRNAVKMISFDDLSKKECKQIVGIPLFADVRDFTSQFDKEDANLEEMAIKTQNILTSMYDVIEQSSGIHVQFQGDREFALFHNVPEYNCCVDAVMAGMKIIDGVKAYGVSVGVGQALGRMFASKIGARGEKDFILMGSTVMKADYNEDENAKANQLVISQEIYDELKIQKPEWAEMFKKSGDFYFTTLGYKGLIDEISLSQLRKKNQTNSYNGAWGA